eukprot:1265860-Amphidinium_carterae.1
MDKTGYQQEVLPHNVQGWTDLVVTNVLTLLVYKEPSSTQAVQFEDWFVAGIRTAVVNVCTRKGAKLRQGTQALAIENLSKTLIPPGIYCTNDKLLAMNDRTECGSFLGKLNWLQSQTQFHISYALFHCASQVAKHRIEDLKAIKKAART